MKVIVENEPDKGLGAHYEATLDDKTERWVMEIINVTLLKREIDKAIREKELWQALHAIPNDDRQ